MDNLDRFGPVLALFITAGVIVLLDVSPVRLRRPAVVAIALAGIVLSLLWTVSHAARGQFSGDGVTAFGGALALDRFALFFAVLFPAVTGFVILASLDFVEQLEDRAPEYFALLLVIAGGAMMLAASNDLVAIFIALELQSVSQYVLAGFMRDARSSEAGLKYLLLGATSVAIMLYGMALLYGLSGSTALPDIAAAARNAGEGQRAAFLAAAVAIAVGFGFKMAIVPFQMWAPDVYQGAPTPVTAYLSVGSKAAAFAITLRLFYTALGEGIIASGWANMFAVLAAVSMTVGNVIAIQQREIKRLLGYSSIAQAGNFLIGVAAISAEGQRFTLGSSAVLFFIASYAFTNLGAFFAVIAISNRTGSTEIADFAGMWRRAPALSLVLAFCLISLTGLPPTAGFIAKIYVFNAAVRADLVWLVVVAVLNTLVSAYYYLAVVRQMFVAPASDEAPIRSTPALQVAMGVAVIGVLLFGVFPTPLLRVAERAVSVFAG
ncbi:MAG: NADH-quinone oxidoreductase subunit N [Dehalococcoidia bacterium]